MKTFRPRTIYDLFDGIRLRPGLYFGVEGLAKLSGFLSGYLLACDAHRLPLQEETPAFAQFGSWLTDELCAEHGPASWEQLLALRFGDGLEGMQAFFSLLDRYRAAQVETTIRKNFDPPHSRLDGDESLRRLEVVERSTDGAWFVWLSSSTGRCGCEQMGYGRSELREYLETILSPELVNDEFLRTKL